MKIESDSTAKLKRWIFDDALPFWADCGVDSDLGGFHERFSSEGLVIRDPRRARVTGRQIYAFATAEQLGWNGPARAVVRHGLAFLQRHLRDDGTFVAPLINPDDGRAYGGFDLYDQAFVLFGLAAAASVGEEATKQRDLARRLRDRMLTGWKHPLAGFEESLPRSLPLRANPHIHLL